MCVYLCVCAYVLVHASVWVDGCVRIVPAVSNKQCVNSTLLSFAEIGDDQPCVWLLCILRSNLPNAALTPFGLLLH